MAHSPFEICDQFGGREAQAEIDRCCNQQRLNDDKCCTLHCVYSRHNILYTDGISNRRLLDDNNKFNYDGKTLSEAAAILKDLHCPFVINQNRYSIFDRTVEKNGLKKTTGILKKGLITFSPLAQGQLTDRYLNGIPKDSRIRTDGRFLKESILDEHRMDQIRKLNELAAQRGEKLADMALGWLLQKEEVTSVLIGASKPQQILDNIKAVSCAPFTKEELKQIDEISLN